MSDAPVLAHLHARVRDLKQPWKAERVLTSNAARLSVVRFEGHVGRWHHHDEDECYVVLEGEILVELEGAPAVRLVAGDAYVVRAGVVHRPFAVPWASVLLVT